MRLPIFLDTDPGIDDAVAIAAAIFAPELDLQLMTTVAGNVSVEKTTRNALQLLHFWNAEIPLAQGAAVPLVRAPRDAASVHGESGMAGYDFVEHNRKPLGIPAFLAIRDALMRAPEPVTLVAIGPLTNIAEIVMCGLDVTNQAILTPDYLATLPELNRTGKMLHALFSHYRSGSMQSGLRMHDLCAIAWLVRPDLFTLKPCFVAVETQGEFTSGTTVVDIDGCLGKPANVQVALDLDVKGFQQWVAEVLALAS
ncbi:MAG: nucleoside hydrolase [Escherichia coli]|nr:nucleoside hydrolase [Escherichia coli]